MSLPRLGYKTSLPSALLAWPSLAFLLAGCDGSQLTCYELTYGETHVGKVGGRPLAIS